MKHLCWTKCTWCTLDYNARINAFGTPYHTCYHMPLKQHSDRIDSLSIRGNLDHTHIYIHDAVFMCNERSALPQICAYSPLSTTVYNECSAIARFVICVQMQWIFVNALVFTHTPSPTFVPLITRARALGGALYMVDRAVGCSSLKCNMLNCNWPGLAREQRVVHMDGPKIPHCARAPPTSPFPRFSSHHK